MKNSLTILTVPAFADNYLWIIHNGKNAVVVDPGDATPILHALDQHQLTLSAILLTHHHADHIGGVPALLKSNQGMQAIQIYGPANDGISCITKPVGNNDRIALTDLGLHLTVIEVPGHTAGHIAYFAPDQHWLFSGDTLFAGGCGRLFEGTPAQMLNSLDKLSQLPNDTVVYCAHEYTLSNLRFALAVEPDNLALSQRMLSEQTKRDQGIPTVPTTIGLEKATNPFLRSRETSVINGLLKQEKIVKTNDEVANFGALREWKNHFA
ncbi:hydroxyacylglutathione hydrolase [Undibacterium sp. RuRC25W]|uniref:hydroxyacylglutathione hydrolase n=1 Tax=Undibacterium sp. RuRC25W TaxID=3413047 RepID=UPI003BF39116